MKKCVRVLILVLLLICFFLAQVSLAEEKEGFVKTLWRKVLNTFRHPVQELTPPAKMEPEIVKLKDSGELDEPEPEPQPSEEKKRTPLGEMKEEEIIERIKHMLEISPEALDFIPDLKVVMDKEGYVVSIKYKVSGIFEDINDLDKETLIKIHNRVNNERVRIQTERIQRQLQAITAAQNIPKPPPQVYIPKQPPRPPQQPPTPPKIPTPPPQPPQTGRR